MRSTCWPAARWTVASPSAAWTLPVSSSTSRATVPGCLPLSGPCPTTCWCPAPWTGRSSCGMPRPEAASARCRTPGGQPSCPASSSRPTTTWSSPETTRALCRC
uniref:Putative secreted protein n=1 Tax=Ixodes ricinus TaxID=34613 RepID=A0A6B0UFR9_IXORI